MNKAQIITTLPSYLDHYIQLAGDTDLIDGLLANLTLFDDYLPELERVADKQYAPGKWTPKDIIQHITDNERIMAYRALRIARNDKTALAGYDEEMLANNTNAKNRTMVDILIEFKIVRQSNIILYHTFNEEMLQRSALCNNIEVSPLAIGFVLIGHPIHHLNVLKERYFTL